MAILDHRGNPVRLTELTQEHAAASSFRQQDKFHRSIADGLTPPKLTNVLKQAEQGEGFDYLTLCMEVEKRDWHARSVLGTRKDALRSLPITVNEEDVDPEIVDAVKEDILEVPDFRRMLRDVLDGLGKGYSLTELVWEVPDVRWVPTYHWRDPRFFKPDPDTFMELRIKEDAVPDGVPLAPFKWINYQPRLISDHPLVAGLLRPICVSHMFKSFGLKDWAVYLEVFGLPLRTGKYPAGASDDQIQTLKQAVFELGTDGAAVMPDTMQMEFTAVAGGAGGNTLFETFCRWLDGQVSKLVLGQTMTTDDGASRAQAVIHNDVRNDIMKADAQELSDTINRDLIRPYVDLNFAGPHEVYPDITFTVDEPEDLKGFSDAVAPLIDRGLRVSEAYVLDKFGIPEPEEDEQLLGSAVPDMTPSEDAEDETTPPTADDVETTVEDEEDMQRAMNRDERDVIDLLRDEALKDWRPLMSPVCNPIIELARASATREEFLRGLRNLDAVDGTQVAEALRVVTYTMRGQGDATDKV